MKQDSVHQRHRQRNTRRRALVIGSFVFGFGISFGSACNRIEYCIPGYCDDEGGGDVYRCKPLTGFTKTGCFTSETAAAFWCQAEGGGTPYQPDCRDFAGGTDSGTGGESGSETGSAGEPWEPGLYITYDDQNDEYLAEAEFVTQLKNDPSLLSQDSAYLQATSSGYYKLVNIAEGDLSAVMGLRSGDVLINVNGYDLGSLDGQMTALTDLEEEIEFLLTVKRGGDLVRQTYLILD